MEGVRIDREAVLGAGVVLTACTRIIDVTGAEPVELRDTVRPVRWSSREPAQVLPRRRVRSALRPHRGPGRKALTGRRLNDALRAVAV